MNLRKLTDHFRKRGGEMECLANIMKAFTFYRLPYLPIRSAEADRCTFGYASIFEQRIWDLVRRGEFVKWTAFIKGHGETARIGYREKVVRCSMQVIFHAETREGPSFLREWIEVDFDYWNPERGAAFAALHLGEVGLNWARRRKTNPFAVAKVIDKRFAERVQRARRLLREAEDERLRIAREEGSGQRDGIQGDRDERLL